MPKTRKELTIYCRQWRKITYNEKRFNKCIREYVETKYDVLFKEFKQFYQELDEANPGTKDITKTKQFKLWKKNQKSNPNRNEQNPQRNDSENEQILQRNDSENEQIPQRNDDQNEQILQRNDSENEQIPQRNDGQNEQILQRNDSENEQIPQRNDGQNEQILQRNDSENEQIPQRNDGQNEQILQRNDSENEQIPLRNDGQNEQIPQRNDDILNEALDGPLSPDNISIDQMDNLLREMINDLQRDDDVRALLNNEELFPPQQEDEGIDLDIEMEIDDPLQEELLW